MKDGVITEIGPSLAVKGAREIDATDKVRPPQLLPLSAPPLRTLARTAGLTHREPPVGRRPVLR